MARCTCGNSRPARKCCAPVIKGERDADSPEALVRARYSAFVDGEMDFLVRTTHPRTMCRFDVEENRQWSADAEWLGFEILGSRPGDDEDIAFVEFRARYATGGLRREHHEISEIRREDGKWWFYDGVPAPARN